MLRSTFRLSLLVALGVTRALSQEPQAKTVSSECNFSEVYCKEGYRTARLSAGSAQRVNTRGTVLVKSPMEHLANPGLKE